MKFHDLSIIDRKSDDVKEQEQKVKIDVSNEKKLNELGKKEIKIETPEHILAASDK